MKKTVSLLLAFVMLFSVTTSLGFTAQAASLPKSGSCGPNAKFTFSKGVLTISGKGKIDDRVFSYEDSIEKVVIKKGITGIGELAFDGCAYIESVSIPVGVTSIGGGAFRSCYGERFTSITIPEGIKYIGYDAFWGCDFLKNVKLPKGIQVIGGDAFADTDFYRNSKNWKNGFLCVDGYLLAFDGSGIKYKKNVSISIPKGTTVIAENVFCDCDSITSVSVPEGVKIIGNNAISFYTIKSVSLPVSLNLIGGYVFGDYYPNDIYYAGTKSASKNIKYYSFDDNDELYYSKNAFEKCFNDTRIHYGTATIPKSNKPAAPKITAIIGVDKSVAVKWSKVKNVKGYQIQCAADKKFTKGKKTVKVGAKANTKRVAKLKANKVYYVRIRSYKIVNKKTVYSKWSAVKSAKTTK